MKTILTITIPTYNRPQQVSERLNELLADLPDRVSILVIDNSSDEIVENFTKSRVKGIDDRVLFHRNKANIGATANICRCLEMADSEWVWTLGDDDPIEPGAVRSILKEISDHQENDGTLCIYFSTGIHNFTESKEIKTLNEYLNLISHKPIFSNSLFISSNVINVKKFHKYLRIAYQFSFSAAPHMAAIIAAMRDGYNLRLATAKIVEWKPSPDGPSWNNISVATGLPLLSEIPGCERETFHHIENGVRMHTPALRIKEGLPFILSDQQRGVEYWYIYYSRVAPFVQTGRKYILNVLFLRTMAELAVRFPIIYRMGSRYMKFRKINIQSSTKGLDRL